MANMKFANNANTTLASSLTAIATSMSVTSASSFPVLVGTDYFYCTLTDVATNLVIEIVKVTVTTGTTWTITRGQDGTTGTAFAAGDTVSLRLVRASLDDFPKLDEANTFTGVLTASGGVVGNLTGNADTVTTNANLTGAITSVGNATTMNSALDSLTDVIIATPTVDQILKYNGSDWVNGAANSISGGSGIEFFNATPIITATGTNNALQILSLSQQPVTTAEQTTTTTSINGTVAASAWLSPALGRTTIDAGIWDYTVFASVNTVGGVSTRITRQTYAALPFVTGTVTTTGTGTSRTATASAGTPFATAAIDASATNTTASYLQTPQGLYQITARTSDTVVTISTLTTYVNEAAVAGTVWKLLFALPISPALTTTIAQYDNTTTQPAFTVTALTKLGGITFVTSTGVRTVTTTYNGTLRNTHIASPLAVLHNQLGGLQGGTANELYHSTLAEYTGTGTGNFVRATSPTITGATLTTAALNGTLGATTPSTVVATTIGGTDLTTTGNTILGNASTDTLNVGNGGLIKDASGQTFIGTGVSTLSGGLKLGVETGITLFYAPTPSVYNTSISCPNGGTVINANGDSAGISFGTTNIGGSSATTKMTLDASGGLKTLNTIGVGNATPSASGAGITFPATQSASTNANTLDDYEEGTWTGTLKGLTTAGNSPTATGTYTKIGRLVMATINFSSVNTSGAAGVLAISGLPFANSGAFALGTLVSNTASSSGSRASYASGTNIQALDGVLNDITIVASAVNVYTWASVTYTTST